MRLIHKKNVIPIICISYTILSIVYTVYEIIVTGSMNATQLNIFLFLFLSILGVGVLSQHYRFDRFSPLTMILLQYLLAETVILGGLKIASCFVDIHPDGYRDLSVSFTIPYVIGAVIYYVCLWLEVKKQNRILEQIRSRKAEQKLPNGNE